jgi:thiosulfate dehydrogenase [quinone] large subunit
MATAHHHGPLAPAVAAWTLLPLRLFLGLTFVDAGTGKLLAPAWFGVGPRSFAAQTRQFAAGSPIGGLLHGAVAAHPLPFGFALAAGELAIGLLVLAGLATRVAAAAGLGLSLLFFLTASWHVRPFFYGPDLPYAVAWLPLLLAGDAGLPSLDRALRRRARQEHGLPGDGGLVAVPADHLREVCRAAGCSWAELCRLSAPADNQAAPVASRRGFLASLGAAGLVVGGATVAGGVLAGAAAMASPQADQAVAAGAPQHPPASSPGPATGRGRDTRRGPTRHPAAGSATSTSSGSARPPPSRIQPAASPRSRSGSAPARSWPTRRSAPTPAAPSASTQPAACSPARATAPRSTPARPAPSSAVPRPRR